MSGALTGWRPALRIARREAARSKARTALVVALIAIPVAAMVFAAVLLRTTKLSERQRNVIALGAEANARAAFGSPDGHFTLEDVQRAPFPVNVPYADVVNHYYGRIKLGDKYRFASLLQARLDDPMLRGVLTLTRGRAPASANEAAVTRAAARAFHVSIGDNVKLRKTEQEWKVVGLFEQSDAVNDNAVLINTAPTGLTAPQLVARYLKAPPDMLLRMMASSDSSAGFRFSVGITNIVGFADQRSAFESVVPALTFYTAGTIGLFIVGVVVSAAFAVSARRQLRALGLAGASGATPRQVRMTLAAQGFAAGLAGVIVGFGLGVVGLVIIAPRLNHLAGYRLPGINVVPGDLLAITLLALATAVVAALVPAIGVARTPVTVALAGRRPLRPTTARTPIIGASLFAAGLAVLGVSVTRSHSPFDSWFRDTVAGGAMLVGAVLLMPWLIGKLERFARRLRGASRLAARSMARNRPRTGPIAAAILAAAGATMALASYDESRIAYNARFGSQTTRAEIVNLWATPIDFDRETETIPPPSTSIDRVSKALGGAAGFKWQRLAQSSGDVLPLPQQDASVTMIGRADFVTMEADDLKAAGASDQAVTAFRAGSVVVTEQGYVRNGTLTLAPADTVISTAQGVPLPPGMTVTATTAVARPARRPDTLASGSEAIAVPAFEAGHLAIADTFTYGTICDPDCHPVGSPIVVVVPRARLDELHFSARQANQVTWKLPSPITAKQQQALRELGATLADEADAATASGQDAVKSSITFAESVAPDRTIQAILLGAITLAALAITAIGLALSAAEARSDDATLLALGAPPRLHRARRAWEALLTAGPACLLAIPLGFLPMAVIVLNGHQDVGVVRGPVAFPWRTAVGLGIALPLVAAGVFWLLSRPRRAVLLRDD